MKIIKQKSTKFLNAFTVPIGITARIKRLVIVVHHKKKTFHLVKMKYSLI